MTITHERLAEIMRQTLPIDKIVCNDFYINLATALLDKFEIREKGKVIIEPDEDGQCPHFVYDCYCGLPDGIIR